MDNNMPTNAGTDAMGEPDAVAQLCDMLAESGAKMTFCGECAVRKPTCHAQWCDSHERMMREGRDLA